MTVRLVRKDATVEGVDFPDPGCSLFSSCRTCPLPSCRYDPGSYLNIMRADLRARIAQRMRSQRKSIEEIMRVTGVSRRQTFRLLKKKVPNIVTSRSQQVIVEGGGGGV